MRLVVSFFRLPNVQAKFFWGKNWENSYYRSAVLEDVKLLYLFSFLINGSENYYFFSLEKTTVYSGWYRYMYIQCIQVHVYPCNSLPEVHVQARNRNQAKTGTNNPLIGQIWSSFLTFSCKSGGLYTLFISRWLTGHCQQVIIFGRKNTLWWQLPLLRSTIKIRVNAMSIHQDIKKWPLYKVNRWQRFNYICTYLSGKELS